MESVSFETFQKQVRDFASDREWDQFHTVRNLLLALVGEVGELASSVQWLGEIDTKALNSDPEIRSKFEEEIADVFIYLLRLAQVADIDLLEVSNIKMKKNAIRYTIENSKGNAEKR